MVYDNLIAQQVATLVDIRGGLNHRKEVSVMILHSMQLPYIVTIVLEIWSSGLNRIRDFGGIGVDKIIARRELMQRHLN
jgi:hypothetical protein